jgi:ubiquinol-cytochrome c reductase cytochrome c subunit
MLVRLLGLVSAVVVTTMSLFVMLRPAGAGESGAAGDPPGADDPSLVAAGEQLYLTGCVSCHGVGGVGTAEYPSLVGVGAASADFYLRTGRMPLAYPVPQPPEKPEAYSDEEIRQLVAYVASLGPGPAIPVVDPDAGDLAMGGELFRENCQACHNSQGIGGALSYGRQAPSLLHVEPTQIAEAVRIGPGQMPVFEPETLSDQDLNSIIRYIQYLQDPDNAGGLRIGSTGPVSEGFVAWLVGLGTLLLVIRWITRERGHV